MSETASAQLNLTSTTGTQVNPVYHYDITVNNTGTTNVGTFWFAWLPGVDFLPTAPLSEASPTGWGAVVTGSNDQSDGSAIEWTTSTNAITPSHSLSGFAFTSADSPAALAGQSPTHPADPVLLSVIYSGAPFSDGGFQFNVTPAVVAAASTTTVLPSNSTINQGDSVTFTATVAPASGSGTDPTGTVTFTQDGNSLGVVAVGSNGTAQLATSTLPVGTDTITATYSGDSTYATSSGNTVEIVSAGSAATTTTLITSDDGIQSGESVTFTATVAAVTAGGAAPTGTVTFSQDGGVLGTAAVQSDGTAALSTSALPIGSDSITASYGGDGNYAASTSAPLTETVTSPATLVPTIVTSKLPASIVEGVKANGAVKLSIANATANAIKGKFTIELLATPDGVIDGSAIEICHASPGATIKTIKPLTPSVQAKITPGLLPAGAYTLLVRVIDPGGNVNDSTTGVPLTVAAPFVALSETFTKMTIPASAVSGAKAHATAVVQITNSGNVVTPGLTSVTLYASLSGVVDDAAISIKNLTKPLRIKPNKAKSVSFPVKQIPVAAAGAYTILEQVIDGNGAITTAVAGVLNITPS